MPTFREDPKLGSKVPMIKTADLNEQCVTNSKILDGCITKEKLAKGTVDATTLANKSVGTEKLSDSSVTNEKISNKAVSTEKLADGSITKEKIFNASITTEKLANESVSAEKLQSGLRNTIASTYDKTIELDNQKANIADVGNAIERLENKIGERFIVEGDVTNLPDEEDLTSVSTIDGREVMKLNDRAYEPSNFSGKGYKILRKNIKKFDIPTVSIVVSYAPTSSGDITITVNDKVTTIHLDSTTDTTTAIVATKIATSLKSSLDDYDVSVSSNRITLTRHNDSSVSPSSINVGNTSAVITVTDGVNRNVRKNILTQDMINDPNTVYEIKYDFDLNSEIIKIPFRCILKFKGGCIKNGTLIGNETKIESNLYKIFDTNTFLKSNFVTDLYPEWFGAKGDGIEIDSIYIQHLIDLDLVNKIFLSQVYFIDKVLSIKRTNKLYLQGNNFRDKDKNISLIKSNTEILFDTPQNQASIIKLHNIAFDCINYESENIVFNGTYKGSIVEGCSFFRYGSIFKTLTNLSLIRDCYFLGIRKHFVVSIIDSTVSNCYINASKINKSWGISSVNSSKFIGNYIDFWKYFFVAKRSITSSIFVGNNFDNIFRVFTGVNNICIVGNIFSNIEYEVNNWGDQYLDEEMKSLKWCIISSKKMENVFPEDFNNDNNEGVLLQRLVFTGNTCHDKCNLLYCDDIIFQPCYIYIANNYIYEAKNVDYNFQYISSSKPGTEIGKDLFIEKLMYKEYENFPGPTLTSSSSKVPCVTFNKQIIKVKNIYYINCDGTWNKYIEANRTNGSTERRPVLDLLDRNYNYFDTSLNENVVWDGSNWLSHKDDLAGIKSYGRFVNRPTPINKGFQYFNTDTHKTITWDGSTWWNPDGTEATS